MSSEVLLNCKKICKNFGATRALIDVDFEIKSGDVCGFVGENGSGKSTLSSIICGVQRPTSGELFRSGKPYKPMSMVDSQKAGVSMIIQEAGTLPSIDVASNIFVGNFEKFTKRGFIDVKRMHEEAGKILDEINASDIQPSTPIELLNFEDRKIVEIARAMYLNPEILFIDETTTALAEKGRRILFSLIAKMKQQNRAVVFISHDLEEVVSICNVVTILRDGSVVGHLRGSDINVDKMRSMMVGRELQGDYYRGDWQTASSHEIVLDIKCVTSTNAYIKNCSFQLNKGEILGIGGLADSGMHELGRMMFGLEPCITGEVVYSPTKMVIRKPLDGIKCKMGYISKDRDNESIILNASIKDNTVMASLKKIMKYGFITSKSEKECSIKQIQELNIKCVSEKQFCNQLSGGNKQKVAVAKWLATECNIYIMDCPTRGIDVGVKAAMYKLINRFKQEGKSIVMISEELPELIGMSDRILIMKDGAINKEFLRSPDVTDTQIIQFMI